MITVIPYKDLGAADYGWLKARYHFSFGEYHDPARMGFGLLRVINDDIVAPGSGFDTHPHRDMEIITFVRSGAITHRDSKGHQGKTAAGDVQVMSAGKGIFHSEHNEEPVPTTLYQIWIYPHTKGVEPRWDARAFPKAPVESGGSLPLLVSGRAEDEGAGALFIHANAAVYGGRLAKGTKVAQGLKALGYLLVSEGAVSVNGKRLNKGDGAKIEDLRTVEIEALEGAEIVLIDVAAGL